MARAIPPYAANAVTAMPISIPFQRSKTNNPSILLDPDLLDAIDAVRVAEHCEKPLSRSAMVQYLLWFAIALMTDERAIAEFIAEHQSNDAGKAVTPRSSRGGP